MTRLILLMCLGALVSGCATGPNEVDPFEPMNRKMYAFNNAVDKAYLKPIATGYRNIMPQPARTGVTNFFRNLGVIVTALNNTLQFKLDRTAVDVMRFSSNLVFGMGGLIDIATYAGIPHHQEDLGQTLGYWGVNSGPYIVLPFFGPSTVRDGLALPVDIYVSPAYDAIGEGRVRWGLLITYAIDTRANLLDAETFLEQAALDRYSFIRDTYLQRREFLIRDGAPVPLEQDGDSGRPKSLLELEAEEFGDDPLMDDYEPLPE